MRIGVDIGGTKVEAAILDERNQIIRRERRPTPRGDYGATVDLIGALVDDLEQDIGWRLPVGLGIPGCLSRATGLVKNANSTWLIGHPFDRDVEARLDRQVRVANDADCFAISEALDGAGQGAAAVFGIILGTGVGAGLVIDGNGRQGQNGIAGEWGHNPLPWPSAEEIPGRPCYCGRTGCLETWLSGPAFEADYERETGTARDPIEIASLVNDGEASALAVFDRYVDRLARGLATVVNLIDPDRIVIGGGLSNIDRLYGELPARIARYAFTDTLSLEVVKNVHGDSSGVRGAAMLWAAGDRP